VPGFKGGYASYISLYNYLNLEQATDPNSAETLRRRFFAADAEEPVQLGSAVYPLTALDKVGRGDGAPWRAH
jgi:hypothetical protein